jgi:hypothetical protein
MKVVRACSGLVHPLQHKVRENVCEERWRGATRQNKYRARAPAFAGPVAWVELACRTFDADIRRRIFARGARSKAAGSARLDRTALCGIVTLVGVVSVCSIVALRRILNVG